MKLEPIEIVLVTRDYPDGSKLSCDEMCTNLLNFPTGYEREADSLRLVVGRILALEERNRALTCAINSAIEYAGGRESEWGERAEAAFEILYSALGQNNLAP